MNRSLPLQRAAMVIATAAAVATLGFAMAAGPSTAPGVQPAAVVTEGPAPTPSETTEVDTIYVEPAATPAVIQEVRRATPAPATAGMPATAAANAAGTASEADDDEDDEDDEGHGEEGDDEGDDEDEDDD